MPDDSDHDSNAQWIDVSSPEDTPRDIPSIEVIPDADTETVTFAWRLDEDEATTAWITADAGLIVEGSAMQ